MRSQGKNVSTDVFLNIPYDNNAQSESLLVAYTASLVSLGRKPRLTFELPDGGTGRMGRIFSLLKSCPVSFHDLSAVDMPVRFNMPFELGLACAIREMKGSHKYYIFDAKVHRLELHLNDLNGIDPKIHSSSPKGIITSILDILDKPGGSPTAMQVTKLHKELMKFVPMLKRKHKKSNLRGRRIYGELVALGTKLVLDWKW
jgi:hypothetical protein